MATPVMRATLEGRQATPSPSPTVGPHPPHCTAFNLPADGLLVFNETYSITLADNAIYQPYCSEAAVLGSNGTVPITQFQKPFVASTIPQIFVIGAMLVIAWTLVVILIITPRTSFVFGGGSLMDRRTILGSARGSSPILGSGGRPWLQKVAATTVFISLLIAAINSLRVAEGQYNHGYQDALALTIEVVGSLEIRIIRVISDTFLWLAQVQTLIRLFPRHKEKVIIKWTGFALITLDTLFSILDNFVIDHDGEQFVGAKPPTFTSAISALWYLFQLSLSVVYMASVFYYSIVKRRFAYFHRKMRNICVVALLSIFSVAIPVVFFVLDISNEFIIGWGDYVRWVGAAAASVVVWEWVERIEALEREERKDGILGREIFEGDEMLQGVNWKVPRWPTRRRRGSGDGPDGGSAGSDSFGASSGGSTAVNSNSRIRMAFLNRVAAAKRAPRKPTRQQKAPAPQQPRDAPLHTVLGAPLAPQPEMPPHVASPVSRSDTTSAASTVYAVIHHPVQNTTPINVDPALSTANSGALYENRSTPEASIPNQPPSQPSTRSSPSNPSQPASSNSQRSTDRPLRSRLARPFRRTNSDVESEVPPSPASTTDSPPLTRPSPAASSRSRFRLRRGAPEPPAELPLFVIRGGGQNGDELVVEPQRGEATEVLTQSPTSIHHPHAEPMQGSPTADAPHIERISYANNSSISSHNPPRSQHRSASAPSEPLSPPNEPPPPFSAVQLSRPATGPPASERAQPNSAQTTPAPLTSAPMHRGGSGTRSMRRSPLSMPVLVERLSDAGSATVPPSVPEQGEASATQAGSSSESSWPTDRRGTD